MEARLRAAGRQLAVPILQTPELSTLKEVRRSRCEDTAGDSPLDSPSLAAQQEIVMTDLKGRERQEKTELQIRGQSQLFRLKAREGQRDVSVYTEEEPTVTSKTQPPSPPRFAATTWGPGRHDVLHFLHLYYTT
ncbi:unnamed protein product [Pleuronectes platessa]|uniref:Uncharacterized protein n=1 Tax=Pleuronectes platessa TaxID=8262 RepID=A0A9N7YPU5_PLEPL|nr:unnamed protein product [Pleuronectes platessa]